MVSLSSLDTGDILLFHNDSSFTCKIIEFFTDSKVAHTGLVIRDPWFTENELTGLYLLQSTCDNTIDAEDGKIKFGVKLTELDSVLSEYTYTYVRKLNVIRDEDFKSKLSSIYMKIHDLPYDMDFRHWLVAGLNHIRCTKSMVKKHIDTFWCSALVGYIYVELGYLPKNTDWSNLSPSDIEIIETTPRTILYPTTKLEIKTFDIE